VTGNVGPVRILICDDHVAIRSGLRTMLSYQPNFEVVGEAENGAEAAARAAELKPDVAILDLRMPQMSGVAAITRIRAESPDTRVLIYTTHYEDPGVMSALEEGAHGVILKEAPREELFAAIRIVAEGGAPPLVPKVAARVLSRLRGGKADELSTREVEVIELASRGASNKDIAKELFLSEATVKRHFTHILRKLEAQDRASAVAVAVSRGLIPPRT
jgi:DNA-binding NarL/FixJ family response regulator